VFSVKVIEVIKNDYLLDYQQKSKVIYVSLIKMHVLSGYKYKL